MEILPISMNILFQSLRILGNGLRRREVVGQAGRQVRPRAADDQPREVGPVGESDQRIQSGRTKHLKSLKLVLGRVLKLHLIVF